MKKSWKRAFSAFLTLAMVLSLLVLPAAAATPGTVGYTWDFSNKNSTFHAGDTTGDSSHDNGTYGSLTVEAAGNTGVVYDTLTLKGKTGGYNHNWCVVASDGSVTVPVTEPCNVAVTTEYGNAGTVGVGTDTVNLEKAGTVTYSMAAAGDVTITGATYLTKIQLLAYDATPTMKLSTSSVTLQMGTAESTTVTATVVNSTGAVSAVSGDATVATAAVGTDNKTITITAQKAGTTTITVTVAGTDLSQTIAVRVNSASDTLTEWVFSKEQAAAEAAMVTLTTCQGAFHSTGYGLALDGGKTLSFPVNGPCVITLTLGYAWNVALGDGTTVDRYGSDSKDADAGMGNIRKFSYDGEGQATITVTSQGLTSYIAKIKVDEEAPSMPNNGKIDVWDFGAQQLSTDKYNNHLTVDVMNAWYPGVAGGTANQSISAFSADGLVFDGNGGAQRLRTNNTKVTRYDSKDKSLASGQKDPYETSTTKYNGYIYSNTSSTEAVNIELQGLTAGDKVTFIVGSNGGNATYHFDSMDYKATANFTGSSSLQTFTFYPPANGSYHLWVSDEKLVVARVYRQPAVAVTVSGSITVPADIPTYSLVFTDLLNDSIVEVTPGADSYTASLFQGHKYAVSLKGTDLYVIDPAITVDLTSTTGTTATKDVVIKAVDTVEVPVTVTGIESSVPVEDGAKLIFTPTGTNSVYVPTPVDLVNGGTAKLETGMTYDLSLEGANDYKITSTATGVKFTAAGNLDVTVGLKPTPAVTGKLITLSQDEWYAPLKSNYDYTVITAAASGLTFTNVDDGYTYTGTLNGDGSYSANLRAGTYLASATVTGYNATKTHVTVGSDAVTRDLLFMPSSYDSVAYAADVYVDPNNTIADKGTAPTFKTVTGAMAYIGRMDRTTSTTNLEAGRVTVHIAPGTYQEQIALGDGTGNGKWANITFTNAGDGEVKLTWYYGIGYAYYSATGVSSTESWYDPELAYDRYAKATVARWGATVRLRDTGFRAENITFESSFNRRMTDEEILDGVTVSGKNFTRKAGVDVRSKDATERAAAIWMDSTNNRSDMAEFKNCKFLSSQDTLGTGDRAYFVDCFIEGQTDYICGPGAVVFDNCTLSWKGYSENATAGMITAPQTNNSHTERGYLFRDCTITAKNSESLAVAAGRLGRPWSASAEAIFLNTLFDNSDATKLVVAEGWTDWDANQLAKNANFHEYGSVTSAGAAVNTSGRTSGTVMTQSEAEAVDVADFFGNWEPTYYDGGSLVTSITVTGPDDATESRLNAGTAQTVQLTATVKPSSAIEQGVTWTVTTGLTVSDAGLVTIPADAAAGTYTVTAASKEDGSTVKGTYTITLLPAGTSTYKPLVHLFEQNAAASSSKPAYNSKAPAVEAIVGESCDFTTGNGSSGGFVYATGTGVTGNGAANGYTYKGQKLDWAAKLTKADASRKLTVTVPADGTVTLLMDNEKDVADKVSVSGGVGEIEVAASYHGTKTFDVTAGSYEITPVNVSSDGSTEGLPFIFAVIWTPQGYSHTHSADDMVQGELVTAATESAKATYNFYCSAPLCDETEVREVGDTDQPGTDQPGTDQPGTDQPTTPETVDKTQLNAKLAAAATAAATLEEVYTVSDDTTAAQVNYNTKFVTESKKAAAAEKLAQAIAAGQAVADDENATAAQVTAAIAALTEAIENASSSSVVQTGTKGKPTGGGSSSSSGGSSSSGSSGGTGTTTTNSDGSVTTVKTDSQGTVTETTVAADGGKVETVTTQEGDVTITVTDASGETLVDIQLPAAIPAPATEEKFVDVPEGHWAEQAINNMAALGMVNGVDADARVYDMTSSVTRGSIAAILYRLSNGAAGKTTSFADVAADAWYSDAVGWAAATGVVTGYSDEAFGPDDTIARQQLGVMLFRFAKLLGLDTSVDMVALSTFTDGADTASWANEGMAWCVQKGIIKGKGANVLDPTATVSRAETAVMLDRMLNLIR